VAQHFVSYHKQQNHLFRTSKEKTTNPFSPKQVGVGQKNIKRERKAKCDFTYKYHTEDPV